MKGQPGISSIYHHANAEPPKGAEATRRNADACKRAWHDFGLIVIDPEDINDEWTRLAFINEADKRYGKRGRK